MKGGLSWLDEKPLYQNWDFPPKKRNSVSALKHQLLPNFRVSYRFWMWRYSPLRHANPGSQFLEINHMCNVSKKKKSESNRLHNKLVCNINICKFRRCKRHGSSRYLGAGNSNPLQYTSWRIPRTEEPVGLHSPWGRQELDMTEQPNTASIHTQRSVFWSV